MRRTWDTASAGLLPTLPFVILTIVASTVNGGAASQDQLAHDNPGWPCTSGRPVDPSYLQIAEATGGQLFMLQPGEADHASHLMIAAQTHPATVVRAVGQLRGRQVVMVPVDPTVQGLFIAVSLQCRQAVTIERPDGVPVTVANAADDVELKTGRLTRVEVPLTGTWRVTIAGQGLFTLSVLAQTRLTMSASVVDSNESGSPGRGLAGGIVLDLSLSVPIDATRVVLLTAAGEPLASYPLPAEDGGTYRLVVDRPASPFRVAVQGADSQGAVVRRVHPALFSPK